MGGAGSQYVDKLFQIRGRIGRSLIKLVSNFLLTAHFPPTHPLLLFFHRHPFLVPPLPNLSTPSLPRPQRRVCPLQYMYQVQTIRISLIKGAVVARRHRSVSCARATATVTTTVPRGSIVFFANRRQHKCLVVRLAVSATSPNTTTAISPQRAARIPHRISTR